MNLPRSSILRSMFAIALLALAFGCLRFGDRETLWLGELTPLVAVGLCGGAGSFLTRGRSRRFLAMFCGTWVVLGLAFWVAPLSIRKDVLYRIIFPIDEQCGPRVNNLTTVLEFSLYWVIENPWSRGYHPIRSPFVSRESQVALGILELAISITIGLLALLPSPFALYLNASRMPGRS